MTNLKSAVEGVVVTVDVAVMVAMVEASDAVVGVVIMGALLS